MLSKKWLFLIVFLSASTLVAKASATPCKLALSEKVNDFHQEFFKSDKEQKRMASSLQKYFNENAEFREIYKKLTKSESDQFNFNSLSNYEQQSLMEAYYNLFHRQFQDPVQLEQLRSLAIKRGLEGHGYKTDPSRTGQEELAELSRRNVERILSQFPDHQKYTDQAIREGNFDSIELEYTRNTHDTVVQGDFILSSKQIYDYSGVPGYNTQYDFNRVELQSDDNIFFEALIKSKSTREILSKKANGAVYGPIETELKATEYARQHGMISINIMWGENLAQFAIRHMNAPRELAHPDQNPKNYTPWRIQLYQWDFTVVDFEILIKTLQAYSYYKLKELTQQPAQSIAEIRKRQRYSDLIGAVGLKDMEMRIPVALPKGIIDHRSHR